MSGETNLDDLLRGMSARLHAETYVFVTTRQAPKGLTPRMVLEEPEGRTLIITQEQAQAYDLNGEFPCRMITLEIHSALEAVGFLARITTALAQHDMGVNPVSGFYHDHLFVPVDRADDAIEVLAALSQGQA